MATEKMITQTLTARIQLQVPAPASRALRLTLADEALQRDLISRLRETVSSVVATHHSTELALQVDLKVPASPKPRTSPRLPTPQVTHGLLTWRDPFAECTNIVGTLGSPQWWDWLALDWATSFRYQDQHGAFTAIRENRRGRQVWYAHRRIHGHLKRCFLGKSDNLTASKLAQVARQISPLPETHAQTDLPSGGDA